MDQYNLDELFQFVEEHKYRLLRSRLAEMNEADIAEFLGELEDNPEGHGIPYAAQGAGGRCVCISGTGCAGTYY